MMRREMAACLLAMLWPLTAPAQGVSGLVPTHEWTVPWEKSRPRDPAVAADGAIWFVGQVGNYVARLDPGTGTFTRFEVDPDTHPHTVIVDKAGQIWYSGNANGMIGRLDPATRVITRYPMPDPKAKDPHTMVFDPAGDLWFTVQNGGFVGRLSVKSGAVRLIAMPTPGARPYGIVMDASGHPWFCEFGTNKIGTVDPATMLLTEYALADSNAHPRRIARTRDGRVWIVDYTRGYLSVLDPRTKKVEEWLAPMGKGALPYALTVDDQDRLWFVETGAQPNRLVGFDPHTRQFTTPTPIESGGGTVRQMVFDSKTGTIWFGTDNNTIGKAVVRPKPIS